MSVTADYVEAVLRRAREPMEPSDYSPRWADRPYRTKLYRGATRIPLPEPTAHPSTADEPFPVGAGPAFDLDSLSTMLHRSYGLHSRRMRLTGNEDSPALISFEHASWARGTASGGGLYAGEVYWVAGPSGPLAPGVYHYSHPHHALNRLLAGDVTDQVRAAVPGLGADHYLLVSVKIWKNSFKYNSFSYHVVTMDVGTLLGTWGTWAGATGRRIDAAMWFDEPALNDLLGLDGTGESVLAAVPLSWEGASMPVAVSTGSPGVSGGPSGARVRRIETERSRDVVGFPAVQAVQRACLNDAGPVPTGPCLERALPRPRSSADPVAVPVPDGGSLDVDVERSLCGRRSSFGAFSATPELPSATLAGVLGYAASNGGLSTEATEGAGQTLTRCVVFATHVAGLVEGTYEYVDRSFRAVEHGAVGRFLQWNYFLNNYNLEQAAATIAVLGRPRAVIEAIGDRGYRLLNAEVGAVAQAVYLAAAAADVGCGAVLGFDNVAIAERLGLAESDEWPMLLIMIGNERVGAPEFDLRLD
ncbi:SagB family peptide dehydrogenase [Pseudonocardia sp.]|uniref:SagB family peptide dehydrogenase n=1 Tax=Pseudonocardia sp. TaxID=60912 RepID=UPI002631ACE9|nr:SagB family peptide dehydrogenase [Pseudonocardia sp.]